MFDFTNNIKPVDQNTVITFAYSANSCYCDWVWGGFVKMMAFCPPFQSASLPG